MQHRSDVSVEPEVLRADCVFCQRSDIDTNILKETPNFRLVADHAPLVEGHILIIPKRHYACYGALPAELDTEFLALKQEAGHFLQSSYLSPIFWEHGIFHQSVFHAHLHCFPFGTLDQEQQTLCQQLAAETVQRLDEIRAWYTSQGQYFYLEPDKAFLYEPRTDDYLRIIQGVFWPKVSTLNKQNAWHSPLQRQQEGVARVAATFAKWRIFEQQGATNANKTSA